MTYEELDVLRESSDEETELAEGLTELIEAVLLRYPFKRQPRSVRFLGAGYGCMEIFCSDGKFTVARNDGGEPQIVLVCKADGFKEAFRLLVSLLYTGIKPEDFADSCCAEFDVQ